MNAAAYMLYLIMAGSTSAEPIPVMEFDTKKACQTFGVSVVKDIKADKDIQANPHVKPGFECKPIQRPNPVF